MEIVGFVMQLGECLWALAKREVSYVIRYKTNLELAKEKTKKLRLREGDISSAVIAAKKDGYEVKSEVEEWLESARKEIQKVEGDKEKLVEGNKEKLNEEGDKEKKKCLTFSWCPDLCGRYKLSKQAVNDAAALDKLLTKEGLEPVSLPAKRPLGIKSTMPVDADFQVFESTRKAMAEVVKALENEDVRIVGLHGMGGVGKTTLMEKLGAHLQQNGLFNLVIMVVVSQNPNVKKMQGQLADCLGMKLDEETEIGRAARLKERLARESKILFVLDDLWTEMKLSEIGIPSEDELKASQSKIVLTTRRVVVCCQMGSHALVGLDVLSPNDSWTLFRNAAELRVVDSPPLNDVARKVAEECGGLPVALRSVAKALRGKTLKAWEEAARRLQTSRSPVLGDDDKVFQCIKLSYDYLRDDDEKSIFMFCCLFPEDFDIEVELLVRYGIGRGLFRDADTIQDARETAAHSVVDYLIDSSLLLESEREGRVKMHDVVRDMGIKVISSVEAYAALVSAGVGLKQWPRWRDHYKACKIISLMHNEIQEIPAGSRLACPLLQVLLMQAIGEDIREIPDELFKDVNKSLSVLHLSGLRISSLPSSLGHLTSLRTLFLDACRSVTDISMLGELKKLEILSLKGTDAVKELPQEIAQLTSLRMLDLTYCSMIESIPPKVISSLSLLEELYMLWSFDKWGQGTNASFEEVTCLRRLRILQVEISHPEFLPKNIGYEPNYFKFNIRLGQSTLYEATCSRELVLDTTIKALPGWFNNVVTGKAEKLCYHSCKGSHNIVEEYDHQGGMLKNLKSLVIYGCGHVMNLMDFTDRASNKPVFTKLETLAVMESALKQICVGQVPDGSLGELKTLILSFCEGLVGVLLPSNLLKHLQNLQKVVVESCDIKEMFGCGGIEEIPSVQEINVDNNIIFPQLTHLVLKELPDLTCICPGHATVEFPSLEYLYVKDCPKFDVTTDFHSKRQIFFNDEDNYKRLYYSVFSSIWGIESLACMEGILKMWE